MIKLHVPPKLSAKSYMNALDTFTFPSLFHLVFELFGYYRKGTEDWENIRMLLDAIDYKNLKDIPRSELGNVKNFVAQMSPEWVKEQDTERCTYLLLAGVVHRQIIVFIDGKIIDDIDKEIKLRNSSVISFLDNSVISQISFTTL